MNKTYMYICILLMAGITYLIRMLPLVIFRKPIKSRFFRSFLYYAPYVTITALIFPAILYCTGNLITAISGFVCAVIVSLFTGNYVISAISSCMLVFILQLFL